MTEPTAGAADWREQPHAVVERDGTRFTLLGTAHVSRSSLDAVRGAIDSGAFDTVAVELDPQRFQSMTDPDALARLDLVQVIRSGRTALFVSMGYTIGIDGMDDEEAAPILRTLFEHQARPEFVYRHRWSQGMLVVWDNRCVTHAATGGYEGHRRLLHRITVADRTLR